MSAPSNDKSAVIRVIRTMKSIGAHPVSLFDGETTHDVRGLGERALLAKMFATDSDHVQWEYGQGEAVEEFDNHLTVLFIYGNDPCEAVCDYWPVDTVMSAALEEETNSWWQ